MTGRGRPGGNVIDAESRGIHGGFGDEEDTESPDYPVVHASGRWVWKKRGINRTTSPLGSRTWTGLPSSTGPPGQTPAPPRPSPPSQPGQPPSPKPSPPPPPPQPGQPAATTKLPQTVTGKPPGPGSVTTGPGTTGEASTINDQYPQTTEEPSPKIGEPPTTSVVPSVPTDSPNIPKDDQPPKK